MLGIHVKEHKEEKFSRLDADSKTFMKPKEWINFFKSAGYKGDYFWTILKGKS